jgi:hypothetical protein
MATRAALIDDNHEPIPYTPMKISVASEMEQSKQTRKMWEDINPCRNTNAFCAPMATINPRLKRNPSR